MSSEIRAEAAAEVWKVVTERGDDLREGGTVVILEAVKKKIPVPTEMPGIDTGLKVSEGDVVREGDVLAVIG
ncbi:biotin/lipoyl-binding carrier protein [Streptomyces sp. H10-C2]|uniref:biotin/lipoyl-binding carrier protein n=1 Tax=unclassified Streptomyces TaxID=2593676 RepID=UPI0024BAAA7B|nr:MULTISPECIES: biotin/lipoyl-binding carrier protein [unclassified Streptomyces]MDJ0343240.1 biotin/lipoyl-binding carrier protein [Streptomyces sp. PH10-H1]MDJ0370627.1 biotin/lipoyl-binding carrier protein [Streptomyces sp. H10-C2]